MTKHPQIARYPIQSHPLEDITDIDVLITLAYDVFSIYAPHQPLKVCTACCMSEKNIHAIYHVPVRALSRDVIYDYLDAAILSRHGVSAEIRYFIPRIFELMAQDERLRYDTELTLDKCYLTLGVWSPREIAVFTHFCQLYLEQRLNKFHDGKYHHLEVLGNIVMFYLAGVEHVSVFFDIILKNLNNDVALINLCSEFYYYFDAKKYNNAHTSAQINTLIDDWLKQAKTRKAIIDHLLTLSQKPIYQTLNAEQQYWIDLAFDWLS